MKNSIEISIKPNDREIEKLQRQTVNFMRSYGIAEETVRTQSMIIQELIKIGTKYGNLSPSDNKMLVSLRLDDNCMTVEVNHPINEAGLEKLDKLDKSIQFFRGYQDPFEAYMIKRKKASINPAGSDSNELELFRIAYEGKATLDFFVNENQTLKILSIRKLEEDTCCAT